MQSLRIGNEELQYERELLSSGFPGKQPRSFAEDLEKTFAARFGSRYAIAMCNGTATLHAALAALGVGPGDEVIVPPLTMASTSLAVLHTGARPVWADVDPETFELSTATVARHIGASTKAIMPVSLYGLPAPITDLASFSLPIVEDSAQCFLGRIDGKIAGTLGAIGSFSFQNSKHMTCGEGGITVTDDPNLALRMRRFSSLGYDQLSAEPGKMKIDKKSIVHPDTIRHVEYGFNYRLSELCAAAALAQLEKLDRLVAMRQKCAIAFLQVIEECPFLTVQKTPPGVEHSYWAVAAQLDTDFVSWDDFYNAFCSNGGDGFYGAWRLTYQEPFFAKHFPGIHCPVAEKLQKRMIQFKTHYQNDTEIEREIKALRTTIEYFNTKHTIMNKKAVQLADKTSSL